MKLPSGSFCTKTQYDMYWIWDIWCVLSSLIRGNFTRVNSANYMGSLLRKFQKGSVHLERLVTCYFIWLWLVGVIFGIWMLWADWISNFSRFLVFSFTPGVFEKGHSNFLAFDVVWVTEWGLFLLLYRPFYCSHIKSCLCVGSVSNNVCMDLEGVNSFAF
jgi:hypothetical protein